MFKAFGLEREGGFLLSAYQSNLVAICGQRMADAVHSLIVGKVVGYCKVNVLQRSVKAEGLTALYIFSMASTVLSPSKEPMKGELFFSASTKLA